MLEEQDGKSTIRRIHAEAVVVLQFLTRWRPRLDGRNILVSDENHQNRFQMVFSASDSKPKRFTVSTYTCETTGG
jgi:hypothetical protein